MSDRLPLQKSGFPLRVPLRLRRFAKMRRSFANGLPLYETQFSFSAKGLAPRVRQVPALSERTAVSPEPKPRGGPLWVGWLLCSTAWLHI